MYIDVISNVINNDSNIIEYLLIPATLQKSREMQEERRKSRISHVNGKYQDFPFM